MTCTAVTVQQTVDTTPGGVFNRPFQSAELHLRLRRAAESTTAMFG
jgi:hypothetical protein